jgi:hypothetical protein
VTCGAGETGPVDEVPRDRSIHRAQYQRQSVRVGLQPQSSTFGLEDEVASGVPGGCQFNRGSVRLNGGNSTI